MGAFVKNDIMACVFYPTGPLALSRDYPINRPRGNLLSNFN